MRLLFQPFNERACPFEDRAEIIDTKEQEEAIARGAVIGVPGTSLTPMIVHVRFMRVPLCGSTV